MHDLQFKIILEKIYWTEYTSENIYKSEGILGYGTYTIDFTTNKIVISFEKNNSNVFEVIPRILVSNIEEAKQACWLDCNVRLNIIQLEESHKKEFNSILQTRKSILEKTFITYLEDLKENQ